MRSKTESTPLYQGGSNTYQRPDSHRKFTLGQAGERMDICWGGEPTDPAHEILRKPREKPDSLKQDNHDPSQGEIISRNQKGDLHRERTQSKDNKNAKGEKGERLSSRRPYVEQGTCQRLHLTWRAAELRSAFTDLQSSSMGTIRKREKGKEKGESS